MNLHETDEGAMLDRRYEVDSAIAMATTRDCILEIRYSGPISRRSIGLLDKLVLSRRMSAKGTIERQCSALTMYGTGGVDTDLWTAQTPPSAVIVRPDQYAMALEFCALLGRCGVHRMAFLPHQSCVAHAWLAQYQA